MTPGLTRCCCCTLTRCIVLATPACGPIGRPLGHSPRTSELQGPRQEEPLLGCSSGCGTSLSGSFSRHSPAELGGDSETRRLCEDPPGGGSHPHPHALLHGECCPQLPAWRGAPLGPWRKGHFVRLARALRMLDWGAWNCVGRGSRSGRWPEVSADFFQVSWGLVHWPDGRQVCPLGHGSQGSVWVDAALHPQLGACVPPPGCWGQRHCEETMVPPAGWGSLNDWMGGASGLKQPAGAGQGLSEAPSQPLTLVSAWMSAF